MAALTVNCDRVRSRLAPKHQYRRARGGSELPGSQALAPDRPTALAAIVLGKSPLTTEGPAELVRCAASQEPTTIETATSPLGYN